MSGDTSFSVTAREILAYLTQHPGAPDTLDGIAEWWLPQQEKSRSSRADVEKALAELVKGGMIIEVKVQGSPSIYRVARKKKGSRITPG
jgi:hypothetical protein